MALEATAEISQFFTFILDKEIYAFEISRVREVLDSGDVTRVPKMPTFMRGVINLRGKVVPVIPSRSLNLTPDQLIVRRCL